MKKAQAQKSFSPIEMEILKWVKEGKTNVEIGQIMGLTRWTIKYHLKNIMKKLDVSNRIQVASQAISRNLFVPLKFKNGIKEKLLLNIIDDITGLYNYHYLKECIKKEIKRASRHNHSFSIVIVDIKSFDINSFKKDTVLKKLAECLIKTVRTTDIVGRMGGGKFCIIMPEIEKKGTVAFTKRLLHEIVRKDLYIGKIQLDEGIATFPEDGETYVELIKKAENSLM
ncbi:MAG: diguanylate cyclase [Nitrospinae bacterium]|nr:diguanylate cyclase [Nitrospinota bacterium]